MFVLVFDLLKGAANVQDTGAAFGGVQLSHEAETAGDYVEVFSADSDNEHSGRWIPKFN